MHALMNIVVQGHVAYRSIDDVLSITSQSSNTTIPKADRRPQPHVGTPLEVTFHSITLLALTKRRIYVRKLQTALAITCKFGQHKACEFLA